MEMGGHSDSSPLCTSYPHPCHVSDPSHTVGGSGSQPFLYSGNPHPRNVLSQRPSLHPSFVLFSQDRPRAGASSGIVGPTVCSLWLLILWNPLGPSDTASAILPWLRLAPLHPAKQRRVTLAFPWVCSALQSPGSHPHGAHVFRPKVAMPRAGAPFCSPPRAEPRSVPLNSLTDSGPKLKAAAQV